MTELLRHLPEYALATFLIVIVPGQGMAMVLRQTILGGRSMAFASVLGNSSGLIVWGAASAIGLSAVFAESDTAYAALKYIGVGYLFLVAATTARTAMRGESTFAADGAAPMTSWSRSYRLGIVTNLTNVKAAVYAVAFTPQFVPRDFNLGLGVFLLVCVWALISTATYSMIITGVHQVSHLLESPRARRNLTWVSAAGIFLLGVGLLVS